MRDVDGEDDPLHLEPGFEVTSSCEYARSRSGMDSKRGTAFPNINNINYGYNIFRSGPWDTNDDGYTD